MSSSSPSSSSSSSPNNKPPSMFSSCCPPTAWESLPQSLSDPSSLSSYQPQGVNDTIRHVNEDDLNNSNDKNNNNNSILSIYYSKSQIQYSKKVIVVFTDVHGVTNRTKSICDFYAKHGYHVIMPDCLRGQTKSNNNFPNFIQWLQQYNIDLIMKDIDCCINYVQNKINKEHGILDNEGGIKNVELTIGTIGFCWGGWVIAKSTCCGMKWKCGISPHPSTKLEQLVFNNDERILFHNVTMPFLLLPAGDDMDNLKPGGEFVETEKFKSMGGRSILFERMNHGWVTRGDLSLTEVKEDAGKALILCLDFLNQHML